MDSKKYRSLIKKHMKAVDTYNAAFEPVINTLADILSERDRVYQQFLDEGAHPLIEHTLDRGNVNRVKNPLLQQWDEFNKSALQYWRDLGLTPSGLKKLNDDALNTNNKMSALDQVLSKLES